MDKTQTTILKSFAIIIMFWHHLFGCDVYLTRGVQYAYFPRIYPITTTLAGGGKICISLFAFLSGYGMYIAYIKKGKYTDIIRYILKFLIQYWVILFAVAIPYLWCFGNYNPEYFIINLFAFLHNDGVLYITLSWYVKVNIELLLICPIVKFVTNRIRNVLLDVFVFITIPCGIYAVLPDYETKIVGILGNTLSSIKVLMLWFVVYYVGVMFAKYNLMNLLRSKYDQFNFRKVIENTMVSVCIIIATLVLQFVFGDDPIYNVLRATLFVVAYDWLYYRLLNKFIVKYNLKKIFLFLGRYSFQYWLLSGMFYGNSTEFTWLLYWPRITVIILIWNFVLLTPFVWITKWIADMIMMSIYKFIPINKGL